MLKRPVARQKIKKLKMLNIFHSLSKKLKMLNILRENRIETLKNTALAYTRIVPYNISNTTHCDSNTIQEKRY